MKWEADWGLAENVTFCTAEVRYQCEAFIEAIEKWLLDDSEKAKAAGA
jgi:hypothetical protein